MRLETGLVHKDLEAADALEGVGNHVCGQGGVAHATATTTEAVGVSNQAALPAGLAQHLNDSIRQLVSGNWYRWWCLSCVR